MANGKCLPIGPLVKALEASESHRPDGLEAVLGKSLERSYMRARERGWATRPLIDAIANKALHGHPVDWYGDAWYDDVEGDPTPSMLVYELCISCGGSGLENGLHGPVSCGRCHGNCVVRLRDEKGRYITLPEASPVVIDFSRLAEV